MIPPHQMTIGLLPPSTTMGGMANDRRTGIATMTASLAGNMDSAGKHQGRNFRGDYFWDERFQYDRPPDRDHYYDSRPPWPNKRENDDYRVKRDIPVFSGLANIEEFLDWLSEVERVFDGYDVDEYRRVKILVMKFKGSVIAWWEVGADSC